MTLVWRITGLCYLALSCAVLAACATTSPKETKAAGRYNHLLAASSPTDVAKPEKTKLDSAKSETEAKSKAQLALRENNDEKAIFYYIKALEFNDKDMESLLAIGTIHARNANHRFAGVAFNMALSVEPQNIEALEGLGTAALKLGQYDEGQRLFERVTSLDPRRVRSLLGLGIVRDIKRDFTAAHDYYSRALQIAPHDPAIMNNYAYSLYLSGSWDEAEQFYIKLLNRDPAHYQGALNLGLLQARRSQLKEALATLERVLAKPAAYHELGYILRLEGHYDIAERLYEMALESSPTYFPRAYENLKSIRALRAHQQPAHDASGVPVSHTDPTGK